MNNGYSLKNLCFLGGGNMAEAIIKALRDKGGNYKLTVAESAPARRDYLKQHYPELEVRMNLPELGADDILLIAVKPQDVKAALAGTKLLKPLVISIAAGLSLKTLASYLGSAARLVRIMPNMPMFIKSGMSGIFAAAALSTVDRAEVESILTPSGKFLWVRAEDDLDAVTAVSGSGPAYVFYFMQAMMAAAVQLGFKEEEARLLVGQTFLGAVKMATEAGVGVGELQKRVSSKKGTTVAAIAVFDQYKVGEIVTKAMQACRQRSEEIAAELVP